jgi:GAF domain-containing protein
MSVFDAEWGAVILKSEDGTSERVYARKRLVDGWVTDARISRQLIDEAMCSGTSRCTIDWDSVYDIDPVSGNPIWHSAMICPIKKRESTLGVLCLSAPISRHEYGSSELNFADTLASMAALLIE